MLCLYNHKIPSNHLLVWTNWSITQIKRMMILNPLKSNITLQHFPSSQSQFYSLLFSHSLLPFFTLLPSSVCFYSHPICFIGTWGKRTGREANSHPQVIRYQWFVIAPRVSSRPLTAECKMDGTLLVGCRIHHEHLLLNYIRYDMKQTKYTYEDFFPKDGFCLLR